jgi:GDP-L-fucose synthase
MNVIVTGATGFLGQTLCRQLEDAGHTVTRLSSAICDLTRADSLDSFGGRYDRIFHLAAWTQAGDFCLTHPGEQWIINQKMNTTVLNWWFHAQPQAKLISIGTSCAYAPSLPHVETNYLEGQPIESLYTYAMTKRMLYVGLRALNKQYGLKYLCLVPSTLYGPGYHLDGRQMHFIFDLIRKILRGKHFGEPVVLWGHGRQRRELIHVRDFVRLAVQLDETVENDLINIGAGQDYSIREFADMLCRKIGYDFGKIVWDQSRYVGAESKFLVTDKLRQFVPDPKLIPLEEGLGETVDWFESVLKK